MSPDPDDLDDVQSREGARAVLLALSKEDGIRRDYAIIVNFCDDAMLQAVVDMAWRHQFSEDRYGFKKDVRELAQYVVGKAMEGRP